MFFFLKRSLLTSIAAKLLILLLILLTTILFLKSLLEKFLRVNVQIYESSVTGHLIHTGGGGESSFLEKTISHVIRQKEFTLFSV